MAMQKATITIVGKRPILFNAFTLDTISLERKEKTGVAGNDPEEWKRSVLKTENNQLYLPAKYIFGCIREGGKYTPRGRSTLLPKISATLEVLDEIILLDRYLSNDFSLETKGDVYIDVQGVKNPKTRGRNIRYRVATTKGWRTTFSIAWESTIIQKSEMEAVLTDAGNFVGLGDGRSIGYGRFDVEKFETENGTTSSKKKKL